MAPRHPAPRLRLPAAPAAPLQAARLRRRALRRPRRACPSPPKPPRGAHIGAPARRSAPFRPAPPRSCGRRRCGRGCVRCNRVPCPRQVHPRDGEPRGEGNPCGRSCPAARSALAAATWSRCLAIAAPKGSAPSGHSLGRWWTRDCRSRAPRVSRATSEEVTLHPSATGCVLVDCVIRCCGRWTRRHWEKTPTSVQSRGWHFFHLKSISC